MRSPGRSAKRFSTRVSNNHHVWLCSVRWVFQTDTTVTANNPRWSFLFQRVIQNRQTKKFGRFAPSYSADAEEMKGSKDSVWSLASASSPSFTASKNATTPIYLQWTALDNLIILFASLDNRDFGLLPHLSRWGNDLRASMFEEGRPVDVFTEVLPTGGSPNSLRPRNCGLACWLRPSQF